MLVFKIVLERILYFVLTTVIEERAREFEKYFSFTRNVFDGSQKKKKKCSHHDEWLSGIRAEEQKNILYRSIRYYRRQLNV